MQMSPIEHQLHLRKVYESYIRDWADNGDRYDQWKPRSILPATKLEIRSALKQEYRLEPEPITWLVYMVYFMWFCDLGYHIDDSNFDLVDEFQSTKESVFYKSPVATIPSIFTVEPQICRVRDYLVISRFQNEMPNITTSEFHKMRTTIMDSFIEVSSLIAEWESFIISIGRDSYVADQ